MEYDFKFSRVDMRTKVNTLVLSEGRSMLQCDCIVPLTTTQEEIDTEQAEKLIDDISPVLLERIRVYLAVVRNLEYDLSEEVSKALQEDFVELRKEGATTESFSMLLTVARFMAMSYGNNALDASLWTRSKELEAERNKRVPKKAAEE